MHHYGTWDTGTVDLVVKQLCQKDDTLSPMGWTEACSQNILLKKELHAP